MFRIMPILCALLVAGCLYVTKPISDIPFCVVTPDEVSSSIHNGMPLADALEYLEHRGFTRSDEVWGARIDAPTQKQVLRQRTEQGMLKIDVYLYHEDGVVVGYEISPTMEPLKPRTTPRRASP